MSLHRERKTRETQFNRIAEKAREKPEETFTSLAHYLTEEYLLESFKKLRKTAAKGLDGVGWYDYSKNLASNIASLHKRLRDKTYQAPDIRRVWIDKGNGKQRPLGISCIEDKIVQRAVTDILNLIYEQDFYDFSYGFRQECSAHQALKQLRDQCMRRKMRWVLDADIQGCFDNFDHGILRELLTRRIKDKNIMRLINQWLRTGVVDGTSMQRNTKGTPQGNIISPLMCNVYMHYVLDQWMDKTIRPLLKGACFIIRYADDFVIGFEYEEDARRVMQTLPKRMGKYGLTIHPEKSHLFEFVPENTGKRSTLDFLGFTHYWTKSQKGNNIIKRRTGKKGLHKAIQKIQDSCKYNRHLRLKEQYQLLCSKLRGLYQYYGIRGNFFSIKTLYQKAIHAWLYWLNKRSRHNSYTWKGFQELLKHFVLPKPKIVHWNV
ncbi:MAG: group II intron reverse transcriptase/maturase [Deltaproteobacteria bacterium]|nr:group II intron reverse transcriptase/maturase [Deltaproteobacteria bacterium]